MIFSESFGLSLFLLISCRFKEMPLFLQSSVFAHCVIASVALGWERETSSPTQTNAKDQRLRPVPMPRPALETTKLVFRTTRNLIVDDWRHLFLAGIFLKRYFPFSYKCWHHIVVKSWTRKIVNTNSCYRKIANKLKKLQCIRLFVSRTVVFNFLSRKKRSKL